MQKVDDTSQMKVLIVGNSSIDKSKEIGFMIDQEFDIVIRMNRYQIEGYEKYLGTKTNIWVLNRAISLGNSRISIMGGDDNNINTSFNMNKKISEDLDEMLLITYVNRHDEIKNLHKKIKKHKEFKIANTLKVSQYLHTRWDELISESFYKPATGLLTIHYFLEKYGKVYLHNFDNGRTRHYWGDDDLASEPMQSKHIWSFDKTLIDELVESERVSYL